MIARVHNLTEFEGEAELKLRTTVDDKTVTTPKTVKIAKGVTEVLFDGFEVPAASEIAFELAAGAGEHADAVSQTVAVRPWGLAYRAGHSGTAQGDETLWTFETNVYLRTSSSLIKSFRLPSKAKSGDYVLRVTASYLGLSSGTSTIFHIGRASGCGSRTASPTSIGAALMSR